MHSLIAFMALGWVIVMNPDGVENANSFFAFGDTCIVTTTEAAVAVRQIDAQTLYVVNASNTPREMASAGGTVCGNGTLFLMDAARFEQIRREEAQQKTERETLRLKMRELLKQGK
jgi:hypothetical protein